MRQLFYFLCLSFIFSNCNDFIDPTVYDYNRVINFSLTHLKNDLNYFRSGNYPVRTSGIGPWEFASAYDWTSGFFPGCLWYAFKLSDDPCWIEPAKEFTQGLYEQQFNTNDHDTGFRIFCSYGNGYEVLNDEEYKSVILQAAQSLATRFNPNVGCIQSWNGSFQVIIDNMMNLEILFWASKNGGRSDFYNIAVSHANKTMENHVRPDGSSYQLVIYDSLSGQVLQRKTVQGYSDSSTWARGQAWGIYGFTMCYRETKDPNYLNTAKKMADYFIDHLPADFVPYWDLNLPSDDPRLFKDASAATIACSGLFELSNYLNDKKYKENALKILHSLINNYLSTNTASEGIILHCAYNVNSNNPFDWDASTIWGDYYFLEALYRSLSN